MAMQLTKAGEYAVRSLLYLAIHKPHERSLASEVAQAGNIPVSFVRKVLETLVRSGLVSSYRGNGGGFTLGRAACDISFRDIIEAVEGPFAMNECLSASGCERMAECPVHHIWSEAQQAVEGVLDRYSLADIANAVREGNEA